MLFFGENWSTVEVSEILLSNKKIVKQQMSQNFCVVNLGINHWSQGLWNRRGPPYHMIIHQGVRNRREIQLTRFALPYDYTCFATVLHLNKKYCIRGNCTSDKYFLYKWSTRLQSIYNHHGRAGRVICISILFHTPWLISSSFNYSATSSDGHTNER